MADESKAELSLEVKRYNEEMCEKYGLPSPFKTARLKQICQDMLEGGMVPQHFNNNAMAMLFACQRGAELGLDPYESVLESFWAMPQRYRDRKTGQWEDRGMVLGLYANKMLDLLHRKGIRTKFATETAEKCEIIFTPPEQSGHEPYISSFTYQEAKTAELVKDGGNWVKWPKAMCRARAISIGWRAMGGIIGKGANLYSKEELEDMQEYETVAAEGGTEVQQPKPEPAAKAGRKPKDKPIDVKPETATSEPAKPAEVPAPTEASKPAGGESREEFEADRMGQTGEDAALYLKYYVIQWDAKLPALEKVEPSKLIQYHIPVAVVGSQPEAVEACKKAVAETGTKHYVLGFGEDRAASKMYELEPPKKARIYLVGEESAVKQCTTNQELVDVCGGRIFTKIDEAAILAQAKANDTGKPHLILWNLEGSTEACKLEERVIPVQPVDRGQQAAAQTAPNPEEKEVRDRLKATFNELIANVPDTVPRPKRRPLIEQYLMAYCGIKDIALFASDLALAERSMLAAKKDLLADPQRFIEHAATLGANAASAAKSQSSPEPVEPAPAAELAKYYQERGWHGPVTSLAERYRHQEKADPDKFRTMMKLSGIEQCGAADAGAFFTVQLAYDKPTANQFAVGVEFPKLHQTLVAIRDRHNGAELSDIPASAFIDTMEKILAGTEEEPNLFG